MNEKDLLTLSAECKQQAEQPLLRPLSADQVAWILAVFDRYLPHDDFPRVSQKRDMLMYGMLYEIMDVAQLCFANEKARVNGTPKRAASQYVSRGERG